MAKVLISGINGFIGQALKKRLESQGHEVKPFDRKNPITPLEGFSPDYIYHLAAYGNHYTQQNDNEAFLANVFLTEALLLETRNIPYKAFIHFGSSSEYGSKGLPMKEEDLLEPLTMYGATKAAATMLCRGFAKKYSKPIVTVRPFSVYGPGEADFRFIPTVIKKAINNDEVHLDKLANHDWIYIEDFLDALEKVVEHATTLQGNAINIGTGRQFTNAEIVSEIGWQLDKPIKTATYPNMRPNDSNVWVANINTLKLLKWKQKHNIQQGLAKTIEYYKKKYATQ